MKGFTQLSLAALVAYASASAINVDKRDSPLKVVLTASGNSEVKVAVTNNGDKAVNLLSKGTFLDEVNPVEKVTMYAAAGSKHSPFILSLYLYRLFRYLYTRTDDRGGAIAILGLGALTERYILPSVSPLNEGYCGNCIIPTYSCHFPLSHARTAINISFRHKGTF
jgi:hypothetical protein